ncbi:hypothetical protein Patl1_26988 [Pistacia atlantica]|uniref:Uncharacterized protein n=1 Tax=Pistacia atlantica TaxID=434234 RepID=A0ACC1B496_9ROSI|nr:hypothetical protein Patl1_26988 [Pistacia atlantica]
MKNLFVLRIPENRICPSSNFFFFQLPFTHNSAQLQNGTEIIINLLKKYKINHKYL